MRPIGILDLVLLLMAVAVVLALLARRLRIPPAVAFVLGGMVLAVTPGVPAVQLDSGLSLTLFLPPLLQANAFFTVWRDFRAALRPILALAVGCVVFSSVAVAWVTKLMVPSLPWAACLVLGAIVSPPDAVAAGAVLERFGLPRRLVTVLEGESMVNDASALVLYRFAVAVTLGDAFDPGLAAASFVLIAAGGVAVGVLFGRAVVWLATWLNDTNLEITASFLAAWASYIVAEALGASGVLSTVACGLVLGARQHETFRPELRQEARATWRFVTFVLEALVFILIGLSLRGVVARLGVAPIVALLPLAAAVTAATVAARFVWIFPGAYLPFWLWPPLRRRQKPDPPRRMLVVAWAGMRGVVSLAAALALPHDFPGRDAILVVTFAVILSTVLFQGLTLAPLIRALRIRAETPKDGVAEDAPARAALAAAQLRVIEERSQDPLIGGVARDLLDEYRSQAEFATRPLQGGAARAEREARLSLRLDALAAGRAELLRLHRAQEIQGSVLRLLEHELDLEELRSRRQLGGRR
jgi:CPA1 family monovalent cation:H+ antiporter